MAFKVARFEQTSNHHLKLRKQKQKQHRMKLRKKKQRGGRRRNTNTCTEIRERNSRAGCSEQLAIKVNRPVDEEFNKSSFLIETACIHKSWLVNSKQKLLSELIVDTMWNMHRTKLNIYTHTYIHTRTPASLTQSVSFSRISFRNPKPNFNNLAYISYAFCEQCELYLLCAHHFVIALKTSGMKKKISQSWKRDGERKKERLEQKLFSIVVQH